MRQEAYRELRRLIVDGQLEPGEKLRDREIAGWLGVSRMPVREAITRLADEGLIEMAANRFTRVRPLSAQEADQAYPLAAALHGLAAELAATAWTPARRDALLDESERYRWALLREQPTEAAAADDALHDVVLTAAANERLRRQLDQLVPRLRQMEARVGWSVDRDQEAVHAALATALDLGDGEAAGRLVADEWRSVGRSVGGALRRPG
jgi:DNA-binding GntR family transcriptional regulator